MTRHPRHPRTLVFLTLILTVAVFSGFAAAAATDSGAAIPDTVEFNRDIRAILSDKCYTCHGPDKGNRKTKLRFDIEEDAFVELNSGGLAIVRGDPDKSVMYQRIISDHEILRMPPAYLGHAKLTDREIALIRRWIEQGAKWQNHWSFIPAKRPQLPTVQQQDWPQNPIDHFVLYRLEREGLAPSPAADRATLIRRATLDLTGLPPTPAEVDAFLNDTSAEAYEKVVDRLLESPRYGERMAIRWLDAARYADTNGYQSDGIRSMWRWRDWVIDAFNRNMPFDQFTIEQIAGDLLPDASRDQHIATGFNRNHRTTAEGGVVEEEFRVEYVADRVETTSTVWLGLTVGCARCHDHKYDPITQKEFYQLFAFFNNVPERGLVYNFGNEAPFIQAPTPEQEAELQELDRQAAAAEKEYKSLQGEVDKKQRVWEKWVRDSEIADWTVHDGLVLHLPLDGNLDELAGAFGQEHAAETLPSDLNLEVDARYADKQRTTVADSDDDAIPFVAGKAGQAASFDGKRYIDAGPVTNFSYLDPFSFAAWIHPTKPNGAILSKTGDFPKGSGHALYLQEGKLFLHVTTRWTDISLRLETAEPIELNRWQHVLVTYNGKRWGKGVTIYLDGQPREINILFDELNYPFSTNEPFRIGAGGGPQNRFHGQIGGVRVYDRALSPDEAKVVPLLDTVTQIAKIPAKKRSEAQKLKMRFCFLDLYAPKRIQQARQQMLDLRARREAFSESIPTVMVMKDSETPRQAYLLKRGAYDAHGEEVEPGVPAILPPLRDEYPNNRLGLARWLVDPQNPLPARVTINRFWQMLFGAGLVKTTGNFGSQGEWPIHLELLDWLSAEFIESGWDVKHIVKTIVMSASYRQSSKITPGLLEKDPENRLLARGPRFRLPAEVIRDQALALAGLLVEKVGGPSVKPYQPEGLWKELAFSSAGYVPDEGDKLYRRSLYTFWRRTIAPPSMVNFDSTDRETCTVRETRTNTPLQALNLMNDVTYVEASRKLAERMIAEGGPTPEERIAFGFRLAAARPPAPREREVLLAGLQQFRDHYQSEPDAAVELLEEGASPRDESLDPVEVASYTGVASLILNLDETITKE